MEKVDFDQLSRKAYHAEAMLKEKDALWLEVFKLPEWYFIARGTLPDVYPYVADSELIEPESKWIYAFTDSNRATFYAKKNNLFLADMSSPLIAVPTNDELISWLESFIENGVKGIFFNADGYGFYAPLKQLNPILQHLKDSYPGEV